MPRDSRLNRPRRIASRTSCRIDLLEGRRLLSTTELLNNGAFSADTAYWVVAGDFKANKTFSNYNFAPGYAYLAGSDGTLATSNDLSGTLSQIVTIPSSATAASLTYYYKNATNEPAGSTVDVLNVRVVNPDTGATVGTVATMYGAFPNNATYVKAGPFNLLPYAGQTVAIQFAGTTNSTNGSVFRIDDVSLQITRPDTLSPSAAPTLVAPGVVGTIGLPTNNTPVPTLMWNKVAGAIGYGVKLEQLVGSTWNTIFNSETFYGTFEGTALTVPMSLAAGTYRWAARAFDSTGLATGYAPAISFISGTGAGNRAVGIDVSHWQDFSTTNWNNIKTNSSIGDTSNPADDTSFMFTKATQGTTYFDPTFTSKTTAAKNVGIPIAGYHFPEPDGTNLFDTLADAYAEADYFVSKITPTLIAGNMVPVLDMENQDQALIMGRSLTATWANAFCERVLDKTGIVPLIYAGVSYSSNFLDTGLFKWPLWRVQYPSTMPTPTSAAVQSGPPSSTSPWPTWSFWQYGSTGTVGGYNGNIDRDVFNGDVAALSNFKILSTAQGSISGILFEDTDADGVRDAGEIGRGGRTVFLDANGNGTLDVGERSVVTASTNAAVPIGYYSFTGVLQGNYQIRQVVPGTSIATSPLVKSLKLAPGASSGNNDFGSQVIDATPPTLASSRFNYDLPEHSISLVFSESIGSTLTADDVTLTTAGNVVPFTFTYDAPTRTATFTPTGALVDGDYRLEIAAGGISDAANNPNAVMGVDFFWLAGDINRDRAVGFDDLVVLSQNYGGSGKAYDTGDLTGDGNVDFDDLVMLSQSYGHSLAAAIKAPTIVAAPTKPGTKKRVAGDVLA